MSSNTRILAIIAALLLLGLAFYFFGRDEKPKFDWSDSWSKKAYKETSDQPYGTQVLHRLLEGYFPGKKLVDIEKSLADELPLDSPLLEHRNYVFVGEGMYLDSLSTAHLVEFVARGNTAFLASKTIPFDLMNRVYYNECEDAPWSDYATHGDSLARLRLAGDTANFFYHYAWRNQRQPYSWSYIEPSFFCDSLPQRPLGWLNDSLVNFADYPVGQGHFLLLTTPIALSNYHLLKSEGQRYAERLLAYLPPGDTYWDAYSRVPERVARRRNGNDYPNRELEEHPLAWLLKQPALAWAWYLLVGLAGAYLVFRAKRRQRIIPILPKNENSSYEFISTIANLHFQGKNYQGLCIQSMRLFLAQVRERYGLIAQFNPETRLPRIDDDFIRRLVTVSEVPEQQVRDLFTRYAATVQFQPNEEMMTDVHLALEGFWGRAK